MTCLTSTGFSRRWWLIETLVRMICFLCPSTRIFSLCTQWRVLVLCQSSVGLYRCVSWMPSKTPFMKTCRLCWRRLRLNSYMLVPKGNLAKLSCNLFIVMFYCLKIFCLSYIWPIVYLNNFTILFYLKMKYLKYILCLSLLCIKLLHSTTHCPKMYINSSTKSIRVEHCVMILNLFWC